MNPLELIGRKRDGLEHAPEEIEFLLSAYVRGEVADYQMAAWLMAVCIRGMTPAETLALTQAMVASGEVLDLSSIPGIKVDKHSTGGVGDKVTLIASSVMSKKIAAGADAIVLDVKFGRGAFMPDVASAEKLAAEMVELGEGAGRRTVALVTAMDNPLGRTVGNALEVQEALDALAGVGDEELLEGCLRVTREMCDVAGVSAAPPKGLRSGAGRQTFERMLAAQGGHLERGLPVAPVQVAVIAESEGHVEAIDALEVGLAAIELGAGRMRKEDKVDLAAGFVIEAPVGARVAAGDPLVTVHARSQELVDRVSTRLRGAWRLSYSLVQRPPHVLARVDKNGITKGD